MRVFVGIPLNEKIKENVLAWRVQHTDIGPVRWMEDESLHITLVPPWTITRPEETIAKLQGKVFIPNFSLSFTQVDFNALKPRLIWATGEVPEKLHNLRNNIYSRLEIEPDGRPFLNHFTIGRFKEEDFVQFRIKELGEQIEWNMRVDSFNIYASELLQKGARYTVLHTFRG
jgi:2'-5' RNA ligase